MTSKKRKREVDLELVNVYEHLADDDESVRLKAAHTLVSKIFKPGVTSDEQTRTILTRLFRGLCSGRKAARLGFSVALTELLSQLPLTSDAESHDNLSFSAIVDILEAQTVPEGGTSGQDERDHYFGRVFGADAVLKSGVLFKKPDLAVWKRLLGLICGVATKKPWLRQECGWIVANCLASNRETLPEDFVVEIIEALAAHKLIRTPEGVAIWLTAERLFPGANLPKSVFKHGDPLSKRNVDGLADILKDARGHSDQAETELEAQGSARWSANLHFAWDVVLDELFREEAKPKKGRIPFDQFWDTVVDKGLFSPSSSTERKAWGFAVWRKVFERAPQPLLQHTFTPQATRCLVNSMKSPERFLQKRALKVCQMLHARVAPEDSHLPSFGLTGTCIRALLESVSFVDFDQVTKSKTLQSVLDVNDPAVLDVAYVTLQELLVEVRPEEEEKDKLIRQKTILNLQFKLVSTLLRGAEQKAPADGDGDVADKRTDLAKTVLRGWIAQVTRPDLMVKIGDNREPRVLPEAREYVKERLALAFEHALRLGAVGAEILIHAVLHTRTMEKRAKSQPSIFEGDIQEIVRQGWRRLEKMPASIAASKLSAFKKATNGEKSANGSSDISTGTFPTFSDGLCLLYALVLFQIYLGETDAVEILGDLLQHEPQAETVDAIVEIVLSFSSKPSKFLRRISVQIFDAFAPHITAQGLESLCRVLETKENIEGQQEMFQAEDVDMEDGTSVDSDVEEIDSDVEVESVSDEDESGSEDEGSSAESSTATSENGDDEDEELAKFDAALASALGTRRLDEKDLADEDESESSDADMDDDEMMELDSKLAEVFRARKQEQSQNKKKAAKDAKENVVNFKNRVLDLIDSYLKHQQHNPLTIDLILPLLRLVRTTRTKQLADRACNILQQFCSRCKGNNVPELGSESHIQHAIETLKSVHAEAGKESSNAHSNTASLTSILIVKALVKADTKYVRTVVDIYASTRVKQLTDKGFRILPGFFTDWNNWCQSARDRLAN